MNYVSQVKDILNPEGELYCMIGSKVTAILLKEVEFACWKSCIGMGLRLQPAQQACS